MHRGAGCSSLAALVKPLQRYFRGTGYFTCKVLNTQQEVWGVFRHNQHQTI